MWWDGVRGKEMCIRTRSEEGLVSIHHRMSVRKGSLKSEETNHLLLGHRGHGSRRQKREVKDVQAKKKEGF